MRLKEKTYQHRRDFKGIFVCDHDGCDGELEQWGYDDENFHSNEIPKIECRKCGRTAPKGAPRTAPDVPAHVHI